MLYLRKVLLCAGIDFDDIMHIDYLVYKYFIHYLSLFIGWLHHLVLRTMLISGQPQISQIYIYQKSKFLKFINENNLLVPDYLCTV